jgi:hypothetical protein
MNNRTYLILLPGFSAYAVDCGYPTEPELDGQQIKIAKIDNVAPGAKKKWEKYEMDGKTRHLCNNKKKLQQQQESAEIRLFEDFSGEIVNGTKHLALHGALHQKVMKL